MPKNLSCLIIDHRFSPNGTERSLAKNKIYDLCWYLTNDGIRVDIIWSPNKHQFQNFQEFKSKVIKDITEFNENQESPFDKVSTEAYGLLRKTPITSIDDLAQYDFLLIHPDSGEESDMVKRFEEKYPRIPKIIFTKPETRSEKERYLKYINGVYNIITEDPVDWIIKIAKSLKENGKMPETDF